MVDILSSLSDIEDDSDFDEFEEGFDNEDVENEYDTVVESGTELDIVDDVMSEDRAREITETIKSTTTVIYLLLAEAHDKKAYRALGYDTWSDYIENELEMSTQRSYQLLDLGKVIKEIEAITPDGTKVRLTEAQARDIKKELPKITEAIQEATEGLSPEEAEHEIERIIEEERDKKREEKRVSEEDEDDSSDELEAAADKILEADEQNNVSDDADDEFIEFEVDGDGNLSPEDSMNLYNFYNVLSGISGLPEPDDFVKIVPKTRREEVENQLEEAITWLNRFQTLWELEDEE